jgi:hypothetical protein
LRLNFNFGGLCCSVATKKIEMSLIESVEQCLAGPVGPFEGVLAWVPEFPNPPTQEIPVDAHRFTGAIIDVMESQLHSHHSSMWKRTPVLVQLQQYADLPVMQALVTGTKENVKRSMSHGDNSSALKRQRVSAERYVGEEVRSQDPAVAIAGGEDDFVIPDGHIVVYLYGTVQDRIRAYQNYEFAAVPLSSDSDESFFIATAAWPVNVSPFVPSDEQFSQVLEQVCRDVLKLNQVVSPRELLLDFIVNFVTAGDVVLAEGILLNLVSKTEGDFNRSSLHLAGKLAMNLILRSNASDCEVLCQRLDHLYSLLIPNSRVVDLSIQSLTHRKFCAAKNAETNRMDPGDLQIVSGSALIVDESQMRPGQLDSNSIKNLTMLNELVQNQIVVVDYCYQNVRFPVSVPALIVSHVSKSLIPVDLSIYARGNEGYRSAFNWTNLLVEEGKFDLLKLKLLHDLFKEYIRRAQSLSPSLSPEVSSFVENGLIEIVRSQVESGSAEDKSLLMHHFVNLSRLIAASTLSSSLLKEHWQRCLELNEQFSLKP